MQPLPVLFLLLLCGTFLPVYFWFSPLLIYFLRGLLLIRIMKHVKIISDEMIALYIFEVFGLLFSFYVVLGSVPSKKNPAPSPNSYCAYCYSTISNRPNCECWACVLFSQFGIWQFWDNPRRSYLSRHNTAHVKSKCAKSALCHLYLLSLTSAPKKHSLRYS